jgi:hypothetical protein
MANHSSHARLPEFWWSTSTGALHYTVLSSRSLVMVNDNTAGAARTTPVSACRPRQGSSIIIPLRVDRPATPPPGGAGNLLTVRRPSPTGTKAATWWGVQHPH